MALFPGNLGQTAKAMKVQSALINRGTWKSLLSSVRQLTSSKEVGRKAKVLFLLLIVFLLLINALNVLNSYVGRDFMTAIENRNSFEFLRMALVYLCVFGASTVVSVIHRYAEEYLGLVWRQWASRQCILNYASHRVYYRLKIKGDIANPDQRIADDIRTFSTTTLSFILMSLNGLITVLAFSGVLWSISPQLFVVSVLYAVAGTFFTFLLGRPLVRLNYDQLDKEANFRSSLIYLRGNAESLAVSRREGHLVNLTLENLGKLVANFRRIIKVNRNLNFFTTGYNWLIQIIPALIIAPFFIRGEVQFRVITQSAIAFTHLLGAFSIIVTQFQSISSYTAVLSRVASLMGAGDRETLKALSDKTIYIEEDRISYKGVTLHSPRSGIDLIRDLDFDIPHGTYVLVRSGDERTRTAFFYGTAGLWEASEGTICRPSLQRFLFMSELPYLPPGTLRELFLKPWPEGTPDDGTLNELSVSEERILDLLRRLEIESLTARFGGLDTRQHWENSLVLEDQQLLVLARILAAEPRFLMMDKPSTTFGRSRLDRALALLREHSISYVTLEDQAEEVDLENYHLLLELKEGGRWISRRIRDGRAVADVRLVSG
ncbi:MAG: ABC transporter [Deltaproteobacteria bacterium CG23_combo_of_CG06-09_8_20_14_all_51_20]|nr:MAG: ABC transporter [Deltaproteobacteria bacterium CG23_combo_of_CG06-09_8_20_14_all_51_20]